MRMLVRALVNAGGALAGGSIVAIALIMTYEVTARYVFNAPTSWALEVVSYLLAWSACLGCAYTLRTDGHIAVDVAVRMLPEAGRRITARLIQLAIAGFALILIVYGTQQVQNAFRLGEISLTPLAVKMWIPLAAVPIGGLLLLLQSLELLLWPRTVSAIHATVVD